MPYRTRRLVLEAFIQQSGLPFKPYDHFKKADLDERQQVYIQLAERVWSIERLTAIASQSA